LKQAALSVALALVVLALWRAFAPSLQDAWPGREHAAATAIALQGAQQGEGDVDSQGTEVKGMSQQHQQLMQRSRRLMAIAFLVVALPFVLGSGWMVYRALWFSFLAERSEGRVVRISGEAAPSLQVEYRGADGRQLRIESDGSVSYRDFRKGDRIRVFYHPDKPELARLDLFLELWLAPLLMVALTAVVFLPIMFLTGLARSLFG
jgi:hypothetical protein